MSAPKEILDLVARFELHRESYTSGQYNETQLRRSKRGKVRGFAIVLSTLDQCRAIERGQKNRFLRGGRKASVLPLTCPISFVINVVRL